MEDYRELGSRYLLKNRNQSLITTLGCMLVAMCLFAFLNTVANWVDLQRNVIRKDNDFEILILTDDRTAIENIVNERFVRSAYLGKAYSWTGADETVYGNALHINIRLPILIKYYNGYIQKKYNVETELNEELLWTYLLDNNGMGYIILLACLLVSYIFAVVGVGIIRNSVQISAMERIKDYGNLRCIGATKKQLRAIVFRESFILESIGIAGGLILGYIISIPICKSFAFPWEFHFIPIILLCLAFYGDMFFAIRDGLRSAIAVNPIEAVRGTYRIKNKKIKKVRSGIWKVIFGIEGDYAYKNIKRNGSRAAKTTFAMAFGLATVFVTGGIIGVFGRTMAVMNTRLGYYQQYSEASTTPVKTYEEWKLGLNSPDEIKKIRALNGIDASKCIYKTTLYTAEDALIYKNLTDDYKDNTFEVALYGDPGIVDTLDSPETLEKKKERKAFRDSGKGLVDYPVKEVLEVDERDSFSDYSDDEIIKKSQIDIYGYDDEDFKRCEDNLIEGTTKLSENGILLVNQAEITEKQDFSDSYLFPQTRLFNLTELKLGDEITVVDPALLYRRVQEELVNAKAYDNEMHKRAEENDDEDDPYEYYRDIVGAYNKYKENWIINSAREKLVEEGKCQTFVVEGILRDDPNRKGAQPAIIVPLNHYFEITSLTANEYSGLKFRVGNIFSSDLTKNSTIDLFGGPNYLEDMDTDAPVGMDVESSGFVAGIFDTLISIKIILVVALVILIIVLINIFNTINVTMSNLQLRRNEFAQLRAIGMTERGLIKTVMLEGGIVWITSGIFGIILGTLIEGFLHTQLLRYIIPGNMYIPWLPVLITFIIEGLVLCGTNVFFFKRMKIKVADELTRSGE